MLVALAEQSQLAKVAPSASPPSAKPSNMVAMSEKKMTPKYSCPELIESGCRLVRRNSVMVTSDCTRQQLALWIATGS